MWLLAQYEATALFSLKPAWATSSGGKSLLLPTPFAIKMALLDAVCRIEGVQTAEKVWPTIRDTAVALRGPQQIAVTNTFTKILKPRRGESAAGAVDAGPFQRTIGYREYVQWVGPFQIGLQVDERYLEQMKNWLVQINYLGKRGGFVQLLSPPEVSESLPAGFFPIGPSNGTDSFRLEGTLHQLDDCSPKMSFEHANIYSGKNIRLNKERILYHVVLPYRLVRSSRSYSCYERID